MTDLDHFEIFYADKLWNLMPAVYRTQDSTALDQDGPLRELCNRIGAQMAVVRRSVDRMWEDQSIETCDDWVLPYIADLLATNLVAGLGSRGQRLDIANTVYYRRRKGTVAILEEIAADITNWDVRVIEFFRRIGRTRHSLDPAFGWPADTTDPSAAQQLQIAEGLVGVRTGSPAGGWADLRNTYGASLVGTAFDEFSHTVDVRVGSGMVGWHNIPQLGVFIWRLQSFPASGSTPVAVTGCPGQYTFDPTGRQVPLFAASIRSFGDTWTYRSEWQIGMPIGNLLWLAETANLYGNSLQVMLVEGNSATPLTTDQITLYPELGRFSTTATLTAETATVAYHYGFSSTIGAGPYDRRLQGVAPLVSADPTSEWLGGVNVLAAPLAALTDGGGTLVIQDSLTYTQVSDVGPITALPGQVAGTATVAIRAAQSTRPVIRLPIPASGTSAWNFTGTAGSSLLLDGLLVSGGNVVLKGVFDSVTISCCTIDPGTADETKTPPVIGTSMDGRPLAPCQILIEGEVSQLTIDRSIVGPIIVQGGSVTTVTVTNSIIQAINSGQAILVPTGELDLSRTTVLGTSQAHRVSISECIIDDVITAVDTQHGCVRFSACAQGSVVPRQYESVTILPGAMLFTSTAYGDPGYCQLLTSVDTQILSGSQGATIWAGAADGSEMGAFARDQNPIRERSIGIKYQEYMPIGLTPAIIYARQEASSN